MAFALLVLGEGLGHKAKDLGRAQGLRNPHGVGGWGRFTSTDSTSELTATHL